LNALCQKNIGYRQVFLDLCSKSPQIFYDLLMWAYNPLEPPERRLLPFILRPKQIEAVNTLNWCIDNQHDFGVEKSRKQGATELVKTFVWKCMFNRGCTFIVGSLKEDDVDKRPDPTTIFAKLDNAIELLPNWIKPKIERKQAIMSFPETNSVIIGETTNENFSVSKRATAIFLDEFGREPPRIAEIIEGSVRDVSGCIIYNSTHWFGLNHPFNLALRRPTTKVVSLYWWENPVQTEGLYTSPKENFVELLDEQYYRKNYPDLLKYVDRCS